MINKKFVNYIRIDQKRKIDYNYRKTYLIGCSCFSRFFDKLQVNEKYANSSLYLLSLIPTKRMNAFRQIKNDALPIEYLAEEENPLCFSIMGINGINDEAIFHRNLRLVWFYVNHRDYHLTDYIKG